MSFIYQNIAWVTEAEKKEIKKKKTKKDNLVQFKQFLLDKFSQ